MQASIGWIWDLHVVYVQRGHEPPSYGTMISAVQLDMCTHNIPCEYSRNVGGSALYCSSPLSLCMEGKIDFNWVKSSKIDCMCK